MGLIAASGKYVLRIDEHLRGIIKVQEAWEAWLIGRFRDGTVVEMGWEDWPKLRPMLTLPNTCICYLSMWRDGQAVCEFQLGRWVVQPDLKARKNLLKLLVALADKDISTLPPRQRPVYKEPSDAGISTHGNPTTNLRRLRHRMGPKRRHPVPLKVPTRTPC